MLYGRVGFVVGMASISDEGRAGAALPRPRPALQAAASTAFRYSSRIQALTRLDRLGRCRRPPGGSRSTCARCRRRTRARGRSRRPRPRRSARGRSRRAASRPAGRPRSGSRPRSRDARDRSHAPRTGPALPCFFAIALSSAPLVNGRGASASSSRGLAFNDFLRPPPGSKSHLGGGEGLRNDGRRPTSRPWRRRGRGGSRRDSRSEAEGTPKGLARPRSDSAPKGARGRLRRRTVRPAGQGGGTATWRYRCALAARRPTAGPTEPRGHLGSDDDARRGRGGRPLRGRAVGGRGGPSGLRWSVDSECAGVARRRPRYIGRGARNANATRCAVRPARARRPPWRRDARWSRLVNGSRRLGSLRSRSRVGLPGRTGDHVASHPEAV